MNPAGNNGVFQQSEAGKDACLTISIADPVSRLSEQNETGKMRRMLSRLNIRNLALVDSLAVSFENGLNVITGETGAGKSVIIGASFDRLMLVRRRLIFAVRDSKIVLPTRR